MTPRDKRDELTDSDADTNDVAAVAESLRTSETFHSMIVSAARRGIEAHLIETDDFETETIDAAAVDALAEAVADTSTNGLYLLRNQIVTNEQVGIHAGDRIHMESARDPETIITYRVVTAPADATEFEATRVTSDDDRPRRGTTSFGAGQVAHSDRFEVETVTSACETVTGGLN